MDQSRNQNPKTKIAVAQVEAGSVHEWRKHKRAKWPPKYGVDVDALPLESLRPKFNYNHKHKHATSIYNIYQYPYPYLYIFHYIYSFHPRTHLAAVDELHRRLAKEEIDEISLRE